MEEVRNRLADATNQFQSLAVRGELMLRTVSQEFAQVETDLVEFKST